MVKCFCKISIPNAIFKIVALNFLTITNQQSPYLLDFHQIATSWQVSQNNLIFLKFCENNFNLLT